MRGKEKKREEKGRGEERTHSVSRCSPLMMRSFRRKDRETRAYALRTVRNPLISSS